MEPGPEQVVYQDQWITVTSKEIRMPTATYQISSVSSVSTWHDPRDQGALKKGLVCGAIAVVPWLYLWAKGENEFVVAFYILIFGTATAFFGLASLVNLWRYFAHEAKTWVQIGVSGMPTNITYSANHDWAVKVAAAIRQAVSGRLAQ